MLRMSLFQRAIDLFARCGSGLRDEGEPRTSRDERKVTDLAQAHPTADDALRDAEGPSRPRDAAQPSAHEKRDLERQLRLAGLSWREAAIATSTVVRHGWRR